MIYPLPNGTRYNNELPFDEQEESFINYVENSILNDYSLIVEAESIRKSMGFDFKNKEKFRYDLAVFNNGILKAFVRIEYVNDVKSNNSGQVKKLEKTIQIL